VRLVDYWVSPDPRTGEEGLHLVTEFAANGALPEYVHALQHSGAWSTARALALGCDIARGLEFVHKKRLVHCDLKPDNIVVNDAGEAQLLGFGLASAGGPSGASGTPLFMSPQIFGAYVRGDPVAAQPSGDVWALGVTLGMLLLGDFEVGGHLLLPTSAEEMPRSLPDLVRMLETRGPDTSRLPRDTPAGIQSLLLDMLAVDVDVRPSTSEVLARLMLGTAAPATVSAFMDATRRYVRGDRLGAGSFGEAFKATTTAAAAGVGLAEGVQVAVKVSHLTLPAEVPMPVPEIAVMTHVSEHAQRCPCGPRTCPGVPTVGADTAAPPRGAAVRPLA
jgi:serine/threonine protein kinase